MAVDSNHLAAALAATLSPDPTARQAAEAQLLEGERSARGFAAALLSLARMPDCAVAQSAALLLKGLVTRRWSEDDERHFVGPEVRERERETKSGRRPLLSNRSQPAAGLSPVASTSPASREDMGVPGARPGGPTSCRATA